MVVIYRATNSLNGKSYIGYDSSWPRRKSVHLWEAKSKSTGVVFHQALKRYGSKNFKWEVLYESDDADFTLNIMEGYFIKLYNTHYKHGGSGYNMSYGGEGQTGFKHSDQTICKFKRRIPWNKGIKTGPQLKSHRIKAGNARLGKVRGPYKGNDLYCKKYQKIHKEKPK